MDAPHSGSVVLRQELNVTASEIPPRFIAPSSSDIWSAVNFRRLGTDDTLRALG